MGLFENSPTTRCSGGYPGLPALVNTSPGHVRNERRRSHLTPNSFRYRRTALRLALKREANNFGLLDGAASGFARLPRFPGGLGCPTHIWSFSADRCRDESRHGTPRACTTGLGYGGRPPGGRRRSTDCQRPPDYLIGPAAKNLLRPAPRGSSRSTCALPPPYRRHRIHTRCWPVSRTSCASAIAALP